jgi:hypothetical protein
VGIVVIVGTAKIMGTASSSPLIRRKKDCSNNLLIQRSGAKSIALQDMILKSVKIF